MTTIEGITTVPDLPSRNVLIITGAGASVNLGRDGYPIPMMSAWAESLHDALNNGVARSADLIGLVPGITGAEFETRLGQFLAFEQALPLIDHFKSFGQADGPLTADSVVDLWYRRTNDTTLLIIEAIRANLFENFSYSRIDPGKSNRAYEHLLTLLTPSAPIAPRFAVVTTNYDHGVETAFRNRDVGGRRFEILDGFDPNPDASPELNPLGISSDWLQHNGRLALLHLHGAVGWYRDDTTGRIRRQPANQPYQRTFGTPALLLPDPTKTMSSLPGAEMLWNEFEKLLQSATHIVILGHSLHDPHLVKEIQDFIGDKTPLVLAYLSADHIKTGGVSAESEELRRLLPEANIIPCEFGPTLSIDNESFERWARNEDLRHAHQR